MAIRSGTVTAFDPVVGLGEVTDADGRCLPFHCVEVADGSRVMGTGEAVTFRVRARLGSWEAVEVTPRARP